MQVVNFDSRQVYADFPVITAQPDYKALAVCSHWLYGFLPSHERLDAARYCKLADQAISRIRSAKDLPLMVGGTGLYLKSLLQGLAPVPEIPQSVRAEVLNRCQRLGPEVLYQELQQKDPGTAKKLHPRDRQRITRAIEVLQSTGRPLSWWQQRQQGCGKRYTALKIGIAADINELEYRLEQRIKQMLQQGAVDEARQAWQNCPDENAPGWTSIGCRELLHYILGRHTLHAARQEWLRRTRAYAKRQMTWFKKDREIYWFDEDQEQEILSLVKQHLK